MDHDVDVTAEIEAMGQVGRALGGLSPAARARVITWLLGAYGSTNQPAQTVRRAPAPGVEGQPNASPADSRSSVSGPAESSYASVFDLVDAAGPASTRDRILVVAYWFQQLQRQPDVTGAQINAELKHLGHGLQNITDAISQIMAKQPQMMRQTRKEGTSQQARKRYALTELGRKHVLSLLMSSKEDHE